VIVAVPSPNPVTTPVLSPTLATEVLLLVHVPPPASVNVEVLPRQTEVLPVIAPGEDTIDTVAVAIHPLGSV